MKKKEKYSYFEEFIKIAEHIEESSNKLKELMNDYNEENLDKSIEEIHKLEHSSDRIVHKMRKFLIKDFLPPIEREDIAVIVNKLDDIEDGIDEILINMKILNITNIKKEVIDQVEILVLCCNAVKETILELKNFKNTELINKKIIQINSFEEQGDKVYQSLMTSLYENEKDSIELIKWTNIYNCLEETIDACEDLGDDVQDVIMKNS